MIVKHIEPIRRIHRGIELALENLAEAASVSGRRKSDLRKLAQNALENIRPDIASLAKTANDELGTLYEEMRRLREEEETRDY